MDAQVVREGGAEVIAIVWPAWLVKAGAWLKWLGLAVAGLFAWLFFRQRRLTAAEKKRGDTEEARADSIGREVERKLEAEKKIREIDHAAAERKIAVEAKLDVIDAAAKKETDALDREVRETGSAIEELKRRMAERAKTGEP